MRPPKMIVDDVSGAELPNPDYEIWLDGVKEVVEWVARNIAFANIPISWKEWQAKLEEWGI